MCSGVRLLASLHCKPAPFACSLCVFRQKSGVMTRRCVTLMVMRAHLALKVPLLVRRPQI